MIDLETFVRLPVWVLASGIAVLIACLAAGIPLARRAGKRAALLSGRADGDPPASNKDRMALVAALAPSILVWLAVMGVSFIGLTGFAVSVMNWNHWTNILVPLSLDGISVSFGGWAFVAVKRGRHPGRAYKIVLAAASLSSLLNFVHGKDEWSVWAGIYLAFLSLAGMAMFHEMLDQFMANHDEDLDLKVRYPRFGQRWIYAPWNTWLAHRTWRIYPPADGTRPTVSNALVHWAEFDAIPRSERPALYIQKAISWRQTAVASAVQQAAVPVQEHRAIEPGAAEPPPADGGGGLPAGDARPSRPQEKPGKQSGSGESGVSPSGPNPALSNADLNAAAENLWIASMKLGDELSGKGLLGKFLEQFPDHKRELRWAVSRCQAARARLAAEPGNAEASASGS